MLAEHSVNASDAPAFFEEYYDRIFRYVLGMVHDSDEAEDLTQDTFLKAYRQRDSLRDAGALVAWLYRIATHITLDHLRQRGRRSPQESEADLAEVELPDLDGPSVQEAIEQEEMSACVQQYLANLPDSYRAVILLHDMHGLTGAEIAETLGVPLATVKIRLHRARKRLNAVLKEGCNFSYDERNVLVCEPKK
jgi:RNA polymerase sigma-70 factor (ECF subfamily)